MVRDWIERLFFTEGPSLRAWVLPATIVTYVGIIYVVVHLVVKLW